MTTPDPKNLIEEARALEKFAVAREVEVVGIAAVIKGALHGWIPPEDDDFDDRMYERVQEIRYWQRITTAIRTVRDALEAAQKEIERLRAWVNDLQAGMYINCVYCGHRYGPDDEIQSTMAEVLKEHIKQCPKHPLSAAEAEVASLREALERISFLHRCPAIRSCAGCIAERALSGPSRDAVLTEIVPTGEYYCPQCRVVVPENAPCPRCGPSRDAEGDRR